MGPIFDRSKEHLGITDAMVIRVRRRLIDAVQAHMRARRRRRQASTIPRSYRVRSGGVFLPEGADWVEATRSCARRSWSTRSWTRAERPPVS